MKDELEHTYDTASPAAKKAIFHYVVAALETARREVRHWVVVACLGWATAVGTLVAVLWGIL